MFAIMLAATLAVAGGAAMGFGWAQLRAESRMADSLSRDSEVKDIEIVGAIASLPQLTERGTRFEFDVEKVLADGKGETAAVPSHISLTDIRSPIAKLQRSPCRRHSCRVSAGISRFD